MPFIQELRSLRYFQINYSNIIMVINRSEYLVGVNIVEMVLRDLSLQRLSHSGRLRQLCIKSYLSTSIGKKFKSGYYPIHTLFFMNAQQRGGKQCQQKSDPCDKETVVKRGNHGFLFHQLVQYC